MTVISKASCFAALLTLAGTCQAQTTGVASANYRVSFEAFWSPGTHPMAFPPNANAHFSMLFGATHRREVSLWQPGQLASPGIKQMAETGGLTMLTSQVQAMISSQQVSSMFTGTGPNAPGLSTINSITVPDNFPELSFVTMIAPSPDWFIGVHNLPMIQNGDWRPSISMDLAAYDAGTDSGTTFLAPNLATLPAAPISLVSEVPLNGAPIGRLVFTLLSNTGLPDPLFSDGMETVIR